MELHRVISDIQRYPGSLPHLSIGIMSNGEARIGAVEQEANSRIEALRIEMSRSLHDHKKRTDDLVDDLATRVAHLEACLSHRRVSHQLLHVRMGLSFSISVAFLLPQISLPWRRVSDSTIFTFSGCHAAPVEKASTAQSQASCLTADDIYRRARLFVDDRPKPEPKFFHPPGQGPLFHQGERLLRTLAAHAPTATSAVRSMFGQSAGASGTPAAAPTSIPPTIPEACVPGRGAGPTAQCDRGAFERLFAPDPRPIPTFPGFPCVSDLATPELF